MVLGFIPVLLALLLAVGLTQAAIGNRRHFELRMQLLELLALATRRGLPLVSLLRKAAIGQPARVARVCTRLARDLEQGEDLGEALEWAAPDSFPPHVRAVVHAAEGTGELPHVLAALAEQTDDSLALNHRTVMTVLYPVVLLLGLFVVQQGVVAVFRTPAVFGAVDPTAGWFTFPSLWPGSRGSTFVFMMFVLIGLICTNLFWRRMALIRRITRDLVARVPWRSKSSRLLAASHFLDTLSHVVRAGVALPTAMQRAVGAAGSVPARARVQAAAQCMADGEPTEDAWRRSGLPGFAVATVLAASRGSTAQLADGLTRSAREARMRYLAARERWLDVVHPLALFALGGLVALNLSAITQVSLYAREAYGLW